MYCCCCCCFSHLSFDGWTFFFSLSSSLCVCMCVLNRSTFVLIMIDEVKWKFHNFLCYTIYSSRNRTRIKCTYKSNWKTHQHRESEDEKKMNGKDSHTLRFHDDIDTSTSTVTISGHTKKKIQFIAIEWCEYFDVHISKSMSNMFPLYLLKIERKNKNKTRASMCIGIDCWPSEIAKSQISKWYKWK